MLATFRDAPTLPFMLDPFFLIAGPIFSEFPTAPVESLGHALCCAPRHTDIAALAGCESILITECSAISQ